MIDEMLASGEHTHLNGYENPNEDGTYDYLNFISSNGAKSVM
jgi:hypothetical protein